MSSESKTTSNALEQLASKRAARRNFLGKSALMGVGGLVVGATG